MLTKYSRKKINLQGENEKKDFYDMGTISSGGMTAPSSMTSVFSGTEM